jgi:hypothetical protein
MTATVRQQQTLRYAPLPAAPAAGAERTFPDRREPEMAATA